jgi:hypothetical protein
MSRFNSRVDVREISGGHLREGLFGSGVDEGGAFAGGGIAIGAIDEELSWYGHAQRAFLRKNQPKTRRKSAPTIARPRCRSDSAPVI